MGACCQAQQKKNKETSEKDDHKKAQKYEVPQQQEDKKQIQKEEKKESQKEEIAQIKNEEAKQKQKEEKNQSKKEEQKESKQEKKNISKKEIIKQGQKGQITLSMFIPSNRDPKQHIQNIIDVKAVFKASKIRDTVPSNVNQKDREIFWAQNICRVYPKFAAELLEDLLPFFQNLRLVYDFGNLVTKEGAAACKEAIEYLKKQESLKPLIWSEQIHLACIDHAKDSVQNNLVGHVGSDRQNYSKRMEKHADNPFSTGENCNYGQHSPFECITSLIADDGVPSRGHRTNIYNSSFRMGALHYLEGHPSFKACCVLDYSSYSQPKGQKNIKELLQKELDKKVQPKIDELYNKYNGGGCSQKYTYEFPAKLVVNFQGRGGQKEQLEAVLDMDEFLYPNVVYFDS